VGSRDETSTIVTSDGARDPIYLNAAATGPIPERAVRAMAAFNAKRATPWTITSDEQLGTLATARSLCARLIGARPDEIALVPNTSTGIHIAASALPIEAGRVILGHESEFPANVYPWLALTRRLHIRYETVPLAASGLPDHDALLARLARGDVGLVAMSWVSYLSGDRADLATIGDACRAANAWFVVDAIQGLGAARLDVSRLPVDVLTCGGQKWLRGPWGSGFCYMRRELVQRLDPGTGGWLSVQGSEDLGRADPPELLYLEDARRFEVATLAYQDFVGLNASLEVLFDTGAENIERRIAHLATRLAEGLATQRGVRLVTALDPARRAGIVSCFALDPAVRAQLSAADVVYSARECTFHKLRGSLMRFSPHVYNTDDDIDRTIAAVGGKSSAMRRPARQTS
jgi:selenocysteine lyase/cysteine desulfurase